jgi:hypothetical protein
MVGGPPTRCAIKTGVGPQAQDLRFTVHRHPLNNPRLSDRFCAVASGSTTAPPPYYSFPAVVGQCRWRPEGQRNLHRHSVNTIVMDATGSAPAANNGHNPNTSIYMFLYFVSFVLGPGLVAKNFAERHCSMFRCYLVISVQSWSN